MGVQCLLFLDKVCIHWSPYIKRGFYFYVPEDIRGQIIKYIHCYAGKANNSGYLNIVEVIAVSK